MGESIVVRVRFFSHSQRKIYDLSSAKAVIASFKQQLLNLGYQQKATNLQQ